MMGPFNFLFAEPYENRKVKRYEDPGRLIVSTCRVNDSEFKYETAVAHKKYGGGKCIVVQNYNIRKQTISGHDSWVKRMTSDKLPDFLADISGAQIKGLAEAAGARFTYKRRNS